MIQWRNPGRTRVPHDLQRGRGHRHLLLGDGGGANQGWHGGSCPVDSGLGSVFLRRQGHRCFDPNREDTEGF